MRDGGRQRAPSGLGFHGLGDVADDEERRLGFGGAVHEFAGRGRQHVPAPLGVEQPQPLVGEELPAGGAGDRTIGFAEGGAAARVVLDGGARAGGIPHVHAVQRDVRVVDAEQAPLVVDAGDRRLEAVEHLVHAPLLRAHPLEGRLEPVGLATEQPREGA
ncbi:hypothetical protein PFZ49_00835 [Microbacterium lacticum]|uniref:hypothetical protein n=1 Tax=Microbacterium lacticum TaxID=33885 RepID=UPI003A87FC24